jgi:hypothetical protein
MQTRGPAKTVPLDDVWKREKKLTEGSQLRLFCVFAKLFFFWQIKLMFNLLLILIYVNFSTVHILEKQFDFFLQKNKK